MKKWLAVLLSVLLLATTIPLGAVSVSAATTADAIVETARSQIKHYGSDINKFTDWFYGYTNGQAWCAIFVSWCANEVGVLKDAIPKQANCQEMRNWFNKRGEYHSVSSGYVPQKGDIVFFQTHTKGRANHVEFVAESGYVTENGAKKVRCVGGNTSNSNFKGEDYVAEKKRDINNSACKVLGYAHPAYGDNSNYNNYTYSFNFNANGGTLGSSGAFSVSYDDDFQILNTTCTRSGYTWAGWHVKRNNDNTWYVSGQGWCSESEISSNNYVKKVYANYEWATLDDSWTSGIQGDCSYTFYAIWIQERSDHMNVFMSPFGAGGYDHITALNYATSSGFTQERIYVWYILYDYNTGDLMNSYSDLTYAVELAIYDPDGELVYSYDYTESNDANWIGIVPQKSGTYTASATIRGAYNATMSIEYEVAYAADLVTSVDEVSLDLRGVNTSTIGITPTGSYPGDWGMTAYFDDTVVGVTNSYRSNGTMYVDLQGLKPGSTDFRVDLFEKYTGNNEVVASITVPITVNPQVYTLSLNSSNSVTITDAGEIKYYTYTPRVSGKYVIYSTGNEDTRVYLYDSHGAQLASNDDGGENRNFRLEYYMTVGTEYTFAVQYYSSSTTGTIRFKFGEMYTIAFDANGGENAPAPQTKDYGADLILTTAEPERDGYVFKGWAPERTDTHAIFPAGGVWIDDVSYTLYAVWEEEGYNCSVSGHKYTSRVVTEPTCGSSGLSIYACSECTHSYPEDIPATGNHTYTNACDATCNTCGEIREVRGHDYVAIVTTAPSCDSGGVCTYTCADCCHSYTETIPATGHIVAVLSGYDATCTEDGLTDGEECSVCGEVLVIQQAIPAIGHVYDDGNDAICNHCGEVREVSVPTCTITSYESIYSRVQVDFTISDQNGIAGYYWGTNKSYQNNPFTETSDTSASVSIKDAGTYYLTAQNVNGTVSETVSLTVYKLVYYHYKIDAPNTGYVRYAVSGSTYELINCTADGYRLLGWATEQGATNATYEPGEKLIADKECTVYYAVWQKIDDCSVNGHNYNGVVTTVATCRTDGVKTYTCSECGDSYTEKIPKIDHTVVIDSAVEPTCTEDGLTEGSHCSRCGEILVAQITLPVVEHTIVIDPAVEPTVTSTGLTEGKHCDLCGTVLVAQQIVDKLPMPGLPDDAPAFVVDNVTAREGEEFTVAIRTQNNSGIVSFKLKVAYDADVLELVSAVGKDFANMSFSPLTNNPFILNWVDAINPDNTTDGVVALLTFRVKEGAAMGTTDVTLSYDAEDVYDTDFNNVSFRVVNGTVTVVEYTPGDVNNDGSINNKDLGLLQRYLNEWDVTLSEAAADTNGDDSINNKDLGLLQRYLNEWNVTLG